MVYIKVITIKQPFASLIAEGIKEYEFRTWKTNYRGQIYIHAGKGVDKKAMKKYAHYNLDYPKGKIIAKANIIDCIKIDDKARNMLKKDVYEKIINNKQWQGYGLKLENIEKIEPIETKGKLSIWNYEYREGEKK